MVLGFAANLMNRIRRTKKLPESEIVILHRGAPNDRKRILGDHITEIRRNSFSYLDIETRKEKQIPMHRVLEIWMDKKVVWKKRAKNVTKAVMKAASRAKKPKAKPSKKKKSKKSRSVKKRASKPNRGKK